LSAALAPDSRPRPANDALPMDGKLVVVTGANSGIGYYTALELARLGATVVLACRSAAKGEAATARINAIAPGRAVFAPLDLNSLASVRVFATRLAAEHTALDILINNAGIMALRTRETTEDGFERQIGVNFLGHFALTMALLPLLRAAPAPRTIQLSSIAHKKGRIALDDLQSERNYHPWKTYQQSKLAMLMFALELQRRSDAAGWNILSLAAHPGIARTELFANGPGTNHAINLAIKVFGPIFSQSAEAGAQPTILAGTDRRAKPGAYYGSIGFMDAKGPPGLAKIMPHAQDKAVAAALWDKAVLLTGAHSESALG
jgi:NAD(P)-dependent dehydrogenase (short-subunit alcohol dehydrogenase family)